VLASIGVLRPVLTALGAAARVTSLFYLVPAATSIMAYLLVDEASGRHFLLGTVMTILGVMLALRARSAAAPAG
jgi:drug/metabolite transporter (DMT)-like permease